jgi:undecaprenyl-diphosphatase
MTPHRAWLVGLTAVAVVVYALMWTGYASHWNWLATIDLSSLKALHRLAIAHPGWVTAWNAFCTVFGPTTFRLLALVGIFIALIRRNIRVAVFLLISVEPSGLVTDIAKGAAHRRRPEMALVSAQSTSFPSGHAVGVMIGVLALLTVALPVVRGALRAWLIAGGAVIVVAVGVGRAVLNVHYPSDVVAGWALGYLYFAACLLIVRPWRSIREADETPAAPCNAP